MGHYIPYASLIYLLNSGTLRTKHPVPGFLKVMCLSRDLSQPSKIHHKKSRGSGNNPYLALLAMPKLRISVPYKTMK